MAGETTRIAKAGDPLRISARKWNALNNLLGERPSRLPGMGLITDSETLILVRNDTGDTLQPFSVVKVGDSLPLPTLNEDEWKYRRIFEGESPAASEMFAITQDGIGSGDVGPALILGVTTCTLNVQDEADTHASPDDDDTDDLITGTSGPAVILWKESGTGAGKKAKVLLTGQGAAPGGTGAMTFVFGVTFSSPNVEINSVTTWTALTAEYALTPGEYVVFCRVAGRLQSVIVSAYYARMQGGIKLNGGTASVYGHQAETGSYYSFDAGGGGASSNAVQLGFAGSATYRITVDAETAIGLFARGIEGGSFYANLYYGACTMEAWRVG